MSSLSLSSLRPPPESRREAVARTAVEGLLALAVLASVVLVAATTGPPPRGPPWQSIPIDVARDGPGRLRLLPGLGPTRAAAVVLDRRVRGPVARVEDLRRVRGIGPKTIDGLLSAGAVAERADEPRPRPHVVEATPADERSPP